MPIVASPPRPGTRGAPSNAERLVVLRDLVALRRGPGRSSACGGRSRAARSRSRERAPSLIVHSIARRVRHGQRRPGCARQTGQVRAFCGAPNAFSQRQNIFVSRLQLDVNLETDDRLPRHARRLEPRRDAVEADRLLERVPDAEEQVLGELGPDQLEPDRQAVSERPQGIERPGSPAMLARDREDVAEVHRERVGRLRAELERDGRRGRRRRGRRTARTPSRCSLLDQRADLLRLPVVGLVVAGESAYVPSMIRRCGSGRSLRARALVESVELVGAGGAVPVADAVIAGEVRDRLCRSHQVVAGQAVLDGTWQRDLRRFPLRDSRPARSPPPPPTRRRGSIPSASFSSVGTPMRMPSRLSAVGSSTGCGQLHRRRVAPSRPAMIE